MLIRQIILKGVNNFEDFTYIFEDEWTKTVPDSMLLMGANGYGKTTLLRSVANLWHYLCILLEGRTFTKLKPYSIFYEVQFAAIEIKFFLPEFSDSLWICIGKKEDVNRFLKKNKSGYKIAITPNYIASDHIIQALLKKKSFKIKYISPDGSEFERTETEPIWFQELREKFINNKLGAPSDLPNIVFLESETRYLPKIEEKEYSIVPEREFFNWLARYTPTRRREGNIQNYLFTLKAIDGEKYDRIVSAVNRFLTDKKIIGFDMKTADLMIKTASGQIHPVYLLSSGEKQVLLMIAFIERELRTGGIVLIDEPDLHLHVSLSTAFVSYLKQMISEKKGQLIIASHAPELWEQFSDAQKVRLPSGKP
ncbi:ATP-binding protein [Desulfococcaceae bacterium HSG8]|nr:ATP-binding protein [Desulfococcaceae bacterium HSG8]